MYKSQANSTKKDNWQTSHKTPRTHLFCQKIPDIKHIFINVDGGVEVENGGPQTFSSV